MSKHTFSVPMREGPKVSYQVYKSMHWKHQRPYLLVLVCDG